MSIAILNWNTRDLLAKFLPQLLAHLPKGVELVVADNGSTDDSVALVRREFPEVRLIELPENYGFSEGYNRTLAQLDSEWVVLLNSDVDAKNDWITPLLRCIEAHPQAGAFQPTIRSYNEPDHFEYAGAAGGYLDHWGFPFCRGRLFETLEKDDGQYHDSVKLAWASGAALCVRRKLYLELGGLDARFFAHMEEIDLCWRIRRAGYSIHHCPTSVVYHVGGGTLAYQSPKKTLLNFRNSYYLLMKNERLSKLLWLLPWRLIVDAPAGIKFVLDGKSDHAWSIVRAHWQFFGSLGYAVSARKKSKIAVAKAKIGPARTREGHYPRSIIIDYFIRGKRYFKQLNWHS